MDLHLYRNSQDRWHDLKSGARDRGAALAFNALTIGELVRRITPDLEAATDGQRLVLGIPHAACRRPDSASLGINAAGLPLQAATLDALAQLKAAQLRPADLRAVGAGGLADVLETYEDGLRGAGLVDRQDRRSIAAARVAERTVPWLDKFSRVV
jgi:hypothetical protein